MSVHIVQKPESALLNECTKHLARDTGASAERWRFPIIEPHRSETAPARNAVTFVFDVRRSATSDVEVIGTFGTLYEPLPLQPLRWNGENTCFRTLTVVVPKGEVHTYRFVVDGEAVLDEINPQRVQLDDGSMWSRFFTDECRQPLCLERWQYALLTRLVAHILPFRSKDGQNFLDRYYFSQDQRSRDLDIAHAYRLDDQVGIVNYIDCLLAREEAHRLVDYRICLSIIQGLLRSRNPFVDQAVMPRDMYVELYEQMARNDVPGWDYARYDSPRFFLQLLRRHAFTGAFSHPRYGGNAAAAGWAFLAERYLDGDGATLFNWRRAIEPPYGTSTSYRG